MSGYPAPDDRLSAYLDEVRNYTGQTLVLAGLALRMATEARR